MGGPRPSNWLDKPGYVAIAAFVTGAAIAGIIVAIVLTRGGDGDDDGAQATATAVSTGTQTPESTATGTPATSTPTPGRYTNARDALAAFVQDRFAKTYLGPCPPSATGQTLDGTCSVLLYESDVLATYFVGPPLSEALGETVITRADDGTWSVDFISASDFIAGLGVGGGATVYGAGDCLNLRAEPDPNAQSLSCQLDGTHARVTEGPVQSGGITWWRLDGFGWASAQYLMATGD